MEKVHSRVQITPFLFNNIQTHLKIHFNIKENKNRIKKKKEREREREREREEQMMTPMMMMMMMMMMKMKMMMVKGKEDGTISRINAIVPNAFDSV